MLLVAHGCGSSESNSPDASDADDDSDSLGDPTVEIGTGVDGFEALEDGQLVTLTLGPQGGGRWGGYHVWHAVRAHGFNPENVEAKFETHLASTDEEIARQTRRYDLVEISGGAVAFGAAPWIDDCCVAEETDLVMSVELTDADGHTAHDERTVHTGRCLDADDAPICP